MDGPINGWVGGWLDKWMNEWLMTIDWWEIGGWMNDGSVGG